MIKKHQLNRLSWPSSKRDLDARTKRPQRWVNRKKDGNTIIKSTTTLPICSNAGIEEDQIAINLAVIKIYKT